MLNSQNIEQVKTELEQAGWNHTHTAMTGTSLNYGLAFNKDGQKFYLNKDTYMAGFDGPAMAEMCLALFN